MLNKNSWYYENTQTNEITDVRATADWWAEDGIPVDYWHWSESWQEWVVFMRREP